MGRVDDFDVEELMKELDAMGDEDIDSFSFNDYLTGANPETARERQEREESEPGLIVGGGDIDEPDDEEKFFEEITEEEIMEKSSTFYPRTKNYRSLLLELFTVDEIIAFERLSRALSITNNEKIAKLKEMLVSWGKSETHSIGGGTNRWSFMYDGYIVKIACDEDGKIDNRREFIYSLQLQPKVIKCYECAEDGILAVFEYVTVFENDDFWKHQDDMRKIISDIAANFLIGDVGISSDNYVNWGFRDDGSVVILDYAYIYSTAFRKFECSKCGPGSYLAYDKDFNNLICPNCGKSYSFKQIRKRISMKDQLLEIGDLKEKGYILSHREEEKEFNPKFVIDAYSKIKGSIEKSRRKAYKNRLKSAKHGEDPELEKSVEEVMKQVLPEFYE